MIVQIQDREVELENNMSSIDEITNLVHEALSDKEIFFSHFVIDGVEVYDDYALYFEEHLNGIESVEVVLKSVREFVSDVCLSLATYLERALPEMERLSDSLYQGEKTIGSEESLQLVEGLDWVFQAISTVDQSTKKPATWDDVIAKAVVIQNAFQEVVEAMENKDDVLFADIVQYEITPALQEIKETINKTLDEEGMRDTMN